MAGKRHSREGPFPGNGMWLKAAEKSAKKSSIFRKCGNPSNLVWVLQSSNTTSLSAGTASSPRSKSMLCICVFVFVIQVYLYLCLRWQGFLITHFVNVTVKSIFKRKERFFVKTWISNNHKQRPSSSWSKSSNTTLCIFQNYMRQTEDYSANKLKDARNIPIFIQGDFLTGFAPPFSVLKWEILISQPELLFHGIFLLNNFGTEQGSYRWKNTLYLYVPRVE